MPELCCIVSEHLSMLDKREFKQEQYNYEVCVCVTVCRCASRQAHNIVACSTVQR
jgi:hypothetical protein